MKYDTCDTFKLIPQDEIDRVFRESETACLEMDYTFLCFEEVYKKVLKHCNKDTIIIDLGCAYMSQAYWFINCKKYIGVDLSFYNNEKFKTRNSDIYIMSGQEFIKDILPILNINDDNIIAICSYVPDKELQQLVKERFKYHHVQYCDDIISSILPKGEIYEMVN